MSATPMEEPGEVLEDRRVRAAQVRMVYEATPKNQATGVLAAILLWVFVCLGDDGFRPAPGASIWLSAVILPLLIENRRAMPLLRPGISDEALLQSARHTVFWLAIGGACWGSASWLMLPMEPRREIVLMVVMTMVMAASSTAKLNYGPFRVHLISLTLVLAIGLLRLGDDEHRWLAFFCLVFAGAVLAAGRDREAAVRRTIRLAMMNERLLGLRSQEHAIAVQARAEAEAARRAAEEADRAKTTFIAATSHDLRQPLHALVQYADLLRHSPSAVTEGAVLRGIDESVEAMADLLGAVLDFSKITLGNVRPEFESFELSPLLLSLQSQVEPDVRAAGLGLRVDARGGWVRSDRALLERVLRNILVNAVRHTPTGRVVVRAAPRSKVVRVLVSDSGIGIPASERSRVFDAYYQAANAARDRRKGLGLGLAIVRDLAGLLGLRVRVRSSPGRGSTFIVDVPAGEAVASAAVCTDSAPAATRVAGAAVLLIDDDDLARQAMALTLRGLGCRVLLADSGARAIAAMEAAEFPPQVLLTDYRLPDGETGLEAIRAVVSHQRTRLGPQVPLPAIVVSGDTSPAVLHRVAVAGFPMLHKPVRRTELVVALDDALRVHGADPEPDQEADARPPG